MVETAILFQYLYYIQDRDLKKKKRYIRSNELLKFYIYSNHIFSNWYLLNYKDEQIFIPTMKFDLV